jgi:Outer membrane protein beta-barrel domain
MRKKITLLSFVLVAATAVSIAQVKYGIKAGMTNSTWKGDAVSSLKDIVAVTNGAVTTQPRTGFHAGAYISIPAGDVLRIEPGVYYSQKGYTLNGNLEVKALNFLGAGARVQVQSHYIDIPVLVKASLTRGLQVYAGPQVSILANNNLHVDVSALGFSLLRRNLDITDQFKRIDAGVVAGVAYRFDNGLNISAGYDHGLSRIDKNSNFKTYNRAIKVGVGFEF